MQVDDVHEMELADTRAWRGVGAAIQVPFSKVATPPEGPTSVHVPPVPHVTATPTIADGDLGAALQPWPSQLPSSNKLEVPPTMSPTATQLLARAHDTPYKWLLSEDAAPTSRSRDQAPWWSTSTMAWAWSFVLAAS
jgi:hypothetical protein